MAAGPEGHVWQELQANRVRQHDQYFDDVRFLHLVYCVSAYVLDM